MISSNEREYLNGEGKKELEMILDQVDGEGKSLGKMYLTQKLQGTNFRMVGIIAVSYTHLKQVGRSYKRNNDSGNIFFRESENIVGVRSSVCKCI